MRPNDPAPINLCKGKRIVVVDLSWSRKDVIEMKKISQTFLILDHHKTALEELYNLPYFKYSDVGAGIDLVWDQYFGTKKMPDFLKYIALRDVWKHKDNEKAFAFTTGLPTVDDFHDLHKFYLEEKQVELVIEKGRDMLKKREKQLREISLSAIDHQWEGHTTSFINKGYPWTSDLGEHLCKNNNNVAFMWVVDEKDNLIRVSLRSNVNGGPDVSQIAKKYGGGGHKHAAGFVAVKGNDNYEKIEKFLIK